MLTPEAQLMAAYQAAQQQPMMPQIPPTYNTANEESGMAITAGGIAAGQTGANMLSMAPAMALPMLAAMPMMKALSGSAFAGSRTGRALGGVFAPIRSLFDPLSAGMGSFSAARKAGAGLITSGVMGSMAALPGAALVFGGAMAIDYASKNVFQGAQDYVATRQLMREMPGIGFGATSVLGGGSGLTNLSAGQVSQANQMIQSIGGRHGLDASASRNLLSNLSQTGMIDTSSVKAMSQSYQKALSDFKLMAKTLQIDIDQTIELYKGLDQLGLRGNAERKAVMSRAAATSSLTGKSFESVMQTVAGAITAGNSLGLSSYASSNVATRAMAVSALAERSGVLPESYLNRVGGYDGYTNRMIELELGMSRSSGAMRMMANMYDTSGRFRSDNLLSTGAAGRSANSFFRNADPYELDRMSQEMSGALPSLVLARVDAIQARHGSGSVRANREQYRFLQTMGIEDPQEQLAFLMSARSAGAGQFAQGLQASNDRVNAAPAAAADAMRRETLGLANAIKLMTSSLTTELRAFGEAMQMASEEAAGRIAVSRGGIRFSPANFQATTQQLGVVSEYIRQGRIDPFSYDPMRELSNIESRHRGLIASGLSDSIAFTGITRAEGQGMLTGRLDRTIARYGYDLPEQIQNLANTAQRAALSTVFGRDVFSPRQSGNDILGGFYAGRNEADGAYSIRSGNNANRGQVTFNQIMENVANMHGQYYDSRTNTMLRTNAFGERQFRNQYGEQINNAMSQFRGNVSNAFREQMSGTLLGEGAGLAGSIALGAGLGFASGFAFGGVGSIPGAIVGAIGGALTYGAAGQLSGTVRAARESIFGDSNLAPRMLGSDIQQMISTSEGAAATRNMLTQQVFGQNYNSLSQSQRMYFDNYIRTSEEAADFSGIVAPEVEQLSEYELANLGLNIVQEGAMRNVFTTTADRAAAESRRNIFRTGIDRISIRNERRLNDMAELASRFTIDGSAMAERGRAYETEIDAYQEDISAVLGQMNSEDRARFVSYLGENGDRGAALQMLREFANQETQRLENRIAVNGLNAEVGSDMYTATAGALLAVSRAGGNNDEAMRLALARTTRMGDMTLGNIFSGSSDRNSYMRDVNRVSRNAAPYLLALQRSQGTDQTPEQVLAASLMATGNMSEAQAAERARTMVLEGRIATNGMNQEDISGVIDAIGGGVILNSDVLQETVNVSEEVTALRAANQYAAAFNEVSSQNLNVMRQERAGAFMQQYGSRFDFNNRTGADVFTEMSQEEIDVMTNDLNALRARIVEQEVAGGDPEELSRLRRQAAQLEEFINLSGRGDETERLVRMASGSLFVNGEFQGGNVAQVIAETGLTGAAGALNSIAALTSENTTRSQRVAAFNALVGEGEGARQAMATRLGLGSGATMEEMRAAFVQRANTPGDTFLQDLVNDVLKSTKVDITDEADMNLQRDAHNAMISMAENLASATTSSNGRRSIRVLPATDITSDDSVTMSGG
jgi:hypothetical protein